MSAPGLISYHCCAPNCRSKYYVKIADASYKNKRFFRVNEKRQILWEESVQKLCEPDFTFTSKNSLFCEDHFEINCFRNSNKNSLNANAVPTLFFNSNSVHQQVKQELESSNCQTAISNNFSYPSFKKPECFKDVRKNGSNIKAVITLFIGSKTTHSLNSDICSNGVQQPVKQEVESSNCKILVLDNFLDPPFKKSECFKDSRKNGSNIKAAPTLFIGSNTTPSLNSDMCSNSVQEPIKQEVESSNCQISVSHNFLDPPFKKPECYEDSKTNSSNIREVPTLFKGSNTTCSPNSDICSNSIQQLVKQELESSSWQRSVSDNFLHPPFKKPECFEDSGKNSSNINAVPTLPFGSNRNYSLNSDKMSAPGRITYHCCAPNCKSNYYAKVADASYKNKHFFQVTKNRKILWEESVQKLCEPDFSLKSNTSYFCEDHFAINCFRNSKKSSLNANAVPTLFLGSNTTSSLNSDIYSNSVHQQVKQELESSNCQTSISDNSLHPSFKKPECFKDSRKNGSNIKAMPTLFISSNTTPSLNSDSCSNSVQQPVKQEVEISNCQISVTDNFLDPPFEKSECFKDSRKNDSNIKAAPTLFNGTNTTCSLNSDICPNSVEQSVKQELESSNWQTSVSNNFLHPPFKKPECFEDSRKNSSNINAVLTLPFGSNRNYSLNSDKMSAPGRNSYHCCAPNCRSNYYAKVADSSYKNKHFFLVTKNRRILWEESVRKLCEPDFSFKSNTSFFCEDHFAVNCFRNSKKNSLNANAVPTLFLGSNTTSSLNSDICSNSVHQQVKQELESSNCQTSISENSLHPPFKKPECFEDSRKNNSKINDVLTLPFGSNKNYSLDSDICANSVQQPVKQEFESSKCQTSISDNFLHPSFEKPEINFSFNNNAPGKNNYRCCAPNCRNIYYTNIIEASYKKKQFFKITANRQILWVESVRKLCKPDFTLPNTHCYFCEDHFEFKCFKNKRKNTLNRNAVPTLFFGSNTTSFFNSNICSNSVEQPIKQEFDSSNCQTSLSDQFFHPPFKKNSSNINEVPIDSNSIQRSVKQFVNKTIQDFENSNCQTLFLDNFLHPKKPKFTY